MKASLLALSLVLLFSLSAWSQDAVFVVPDQEELVSDETQIEPRAPGLQGIVAQVLRALQPLQLINPFAPKFYGTGEANISKDDSFGQSYPSQPGLIVFGAEFE